ncbi:MAG: ABC transporter substrate-binding protein [Candidatus Omnitrophica bacterium]|nr:ABC transporter substrate-binding protein [Candidatus Omnitrophota bacterium]MBU4458124.1 ABC transporter substrate-binding protein [Candidatus Omnitrophota bacterium]
MKKIVLLLTFLLIALECQAGQYRIVSLAPNVTEILFALGLGDSIVGVDKYSDYPEEAKKIERLGTFDKPNIERIILLKPDYIFVSSDMGIDRLSYLEGLGVKVIKISPKSIDELRKGIAMLGIIFDRKPQARLLIEDMEHRINNVSHNIKGKRPKVFVQLFDDPLVTVSFFIGDLIELAGGKNIAWDVKEGAGLFSYEVLIERNPDIIIVCGFSRGMNLPPSINAVRNNRIYKDIDPNILLRPGPRAIDAIEELNRLFYETN